MSPILFQLEGGAVIQGHVLVVDAAAAPFHCCCCCAATIRSWMGMIRRPTAGDHGKTRNGGTAMRHGKEAAAGKTAAVCHDFKKLFVLCGTK